MLKQSIASMRRARILIGTLLCLSATVPGLAWADVRLPRLISDGMVLQRDEPLRVWGWARPGEVVRVQFQGQTRNATTDKRGQWSVSIGPFAAGGPYELTVKGDNEVRLRDVLVGDVWLASGQSNMEYALKNQSDRVDNADQEIASAQFPRIRIFATDHFTAMQPQEDLTSRGWQSVSPSTVAEFSAVAYFFGRELHQRYNVPIGLIQSTWGGTPANAWMSRRALERFESFNAILPLVSESSRSQYDSLMQKRWDWYERHKQEDRGRIARQALWADPALDDDRWPTMQLPRSIDQLATDFGGSVDVVWFRKEIDMPETASNCDATLQLQSVVYDDIAYFNGEVIGQGGGASGTRNYVIPATLIRPGRNVLTLRVTGTRNSNVTYTGIYGPELTLTHCAGQRRSLAGTWSYQTGPEIADLPVIDPKLISLYHRSAPPPSTLFNGMIKPVTSYRVKGVLWYQGEADADKNRVASYQSLFPALIRDWRREWGYEVPFLFVQLAGYGANQPEPADYPWAELREAQSMTLSLPRTAMATAIDIGNEKDIHPSNKQGVGHRLALAAIKTAYGEDIVAAGPTYRSMRIEQDRVRIRYDNVGKGLVIPDKYGFVRGFEIAGADGKFHWAQARRDGNDILVFNEQIQQPVAVRYCWSNTPDGNVFNEAGLPALPFRTDAPAPAGLSSTMSSR